MSVTESGLAVADGVRGNTFEHLPPPDGPDTAPGITVLHEDGFVPRNSGRPDLYPYAPQHRGASHVLAGRLDEVMAPEPVPAPAAPAGIQIPRSPLTVPPAPVSAPAATE